MAEQQDNSRLADIGCGMEGGEGIEDEGEVGDGATAENRDRLAVDSAGGMDLSMVVAAEIAAGSARQYAPWTPVWLEVEELD